MSTSQINWNFKSVYSRNLIWNGKAWIDQEDLMNMPNHEHLNRLKHSDPFKGPPILFTKHF
jgi:hypothetical protein